MGGGASVPSEAELRRRRAKRRYKRLKREHNRMSEELKKRQGVDDYGVKCFFDDNGEPFYFDEDGYVFYLDETRKPYYKDVEGTVCYVDDDGLLYYIDKKGRQFYYDDNGMVYYKEDDGTIYYLDKYGEKYYIDEKGNSYYIDEFNEVYHIDNKGREYYLDEQGRTLYKDTKGRKYYLQDNQQIVVNSEQEKELKRAEEKVREEQEDLDTEMRIPIYMRNRVTSYKYARKGSSQLTVSGVTIKTGTPRSWKQGKEYPLEEGEEGDDIELPDELTRTVTPQSMMTVSEGPASTAEPEEDLSGTIGPSPVPVIDNEKLAEEYDMEVVNFDTLRQHQKEKDHKVLRQILEEELDKRKLPARQMAKKVGDFPVKIKSDKMKCSITGAVFLGDGSLVMTDYNNKKIKLFNSELEFASALKLDFFPQSMWGNPKEFELYVTFKSAVINAIQVVKVEREQFTLIRKMNLTGVAHGISGSNKGLAVVVRTFEGWQIHLLSLRGQILRKMSHEIDDEDLFISPHHVTVHDQTNIFVSDRGANQIHGFNSYGDLQCTAEGIRDPKGLCSNLDGSLYVTNPGGMHQISEGCHKVGTIINRQQIGFPPSNVCYDEQDRLVVLTGDSDTMAAFQISDQKGYYYHLKKHDDEKEMQKAKKEMSKSKLKPARSVSVTMSAITEAKRDGDTATPADANWIVKSAMADAKNTADDVSVCDSVN